MEENIIVSDRDGNENRGPEKAGGSYSGESFW